MEKIDFFSPPDDCCVCSSAERFYLYDDEGASRVYLNLQRLRNDCTPVENKSGEAVVLRPVDHVLYPESEGPVHCDAFLHDVSRSCLCFVEMKCVRAGWKTEPVAQLEQTVLDFLASHKNAALLARRKRAVAANSKHPNFQFSEAVRIRNFHAKTGFTLYFENCVRIG